MKAFRKVALLAMTLMLAGAALAYLGRPSMPLADRIGRPDLAQWFPAAFGGWRVDDSLAVVLPAPDVQARLDAIYNQVLTRTYVDVAGRRVMLSVAYGGDQSDATRAHRPEVCYPVQGFNILSDRLATHRSAGLVLPVRQLMATLGERKEPITYWIMVGDQVALSGLDQKLAQFRYGMSGVIADGMLVRVSTLDSNMAHGHAVQAGFIADLATAMPAPQRPRVFGGRVL